MTWGTETYVRKFWERVERTPTCWLWTGRKNPQGYGQLIWFGANARAHRVSYLLTKGPIAEGLVIDHLCRVRLCVNPEHLEAVTQRENLLRGDTIIAKAAAKTHCDSGHPLDGDNLVVDGRGARQCLICRRRRTNETARRRLDRLSLLTADGA